MHIINNNLLLELIEETGLNYSEISKTAEISRKTIYNISFGQTCPTIQVISNLAGSLEMTKDDFLDIFFPNTKFKEAVK